MGHGFDAVLFDMDGVVVDSETHWIPLENERVLPAAVETGDPTAAEITGMNVRDVHGYLDREYGTSLDADEFVALYDEAAEELYTERVTLMSGFEDLVATLRGRGVAVALVSSSLHRWIGYVLDRFGLRDRFDAVVSGEEVDGPSKPAPDVYLLAADRLGVEPRDCVAVEDSTHGIDAALAAGMDCLGYRTTTNADADLSAATAVVEGPAGLRSWFDRDG